MKFSNILGVAAATFLIAGAASAATTYCESGGPGPDNPIDGPFGNIAGGINFDQCNFQFNDFNATGPTVDIVGHTLVFGSITDQPGTNGLYQDGWTFEYLGDPSEYNVTFRWVDVGTGNNGNFDGSLLLNDVDVLDVNGGSGEFTFWARSGMDSFVLDAADPDGTSRENLRWSVEVSPVPLPAAGWLLLAGVGGLAAMKRKKRNA
ncbi:MAG: VPLPA-CTERM sorting domain-containing protein [Pseudomonadota bacterium]